MAYKRFQNTVAESKLLLPFSIAVTAAALYLSGIVDGGWWVQLMCLVVSTALLVELNNTNQLLRVVSQCTPAVFLLLVSVAIGIFPELEAGIMQLCMIALYYMLFHCHNRASGTRSRFTFLQRLFWDAEGWPYFEGGKVLAEDLAPLFGR